MRSPLKPPSKRAWQRMLSGRRLDLLDPSPLDIEIEDIAHGLARVARWNGQTSGDHAFSVAQHSLLVEELCSHFKPNIDIRIKRTALLHDAAEYVVGDMISPFKAALGIDYKDFEDTLMCAIHIRFGLPANASLETQKFIKRADKASAFLEATQLAGFDDKEAARFFGRPRGLTGKAVAKFFGLQPWPVHEAQEKFLTRFDDLKSD